VSSRIRRVTFAVALVNLICVCSAYAQESAAPRNLCASGAAPFAASSSQSQWNGWGNDSTQRRFQTAERAGLSPDAVPRLKLKWAFGFPGASMAYGQPTVAGRRLFVGSADGTVYALGADTGCLYWTYKAGAPVRTAISIGKAADGWAIYFGDQQANAYAVDATTGKLLWKTRVDTHAGARITGAPTLADGRLYVPASSLEELLAADPKYPCCSFRGSVSALDASTGAVMWKSYTIAEEPKPVRRNRLGVQLSGPSGAAVWSAPTVDLERGMVFVTTGDNYSDPATATSDAFIAFDLKTGKLLWSRQTTAGDAFTVDCDLPDQVKANCPTANGPDHDFGSSPVLVTLANGRRALIAGQKSGVVHAVDPDRQGEILWQRKIGQGGRIGGIQWGIAADGDNVYAAVSDVQITAPPQGGEGGRPSVFGIPLMLNPKAGGGLYALDLKTGAIAWHTPHPGCGDTPGCSPAQSAATTVIPGVVFSGGLDGHLRAYDAKHGRIIWDTDTLRKFDTVNGVDAKGGSLDGSGAVVADGTVYVNSGYLFTGHTPGNVLLAFSTDVR
jgi:polyvinyl alcohol dehydrogenase (cytochrome)